MTRRGSVPFSLLRVLGAALVFFAAAYFSLLIARGHAATSPLWPANALALVVFLRVTRTRAERALSLAGIFGASAAANLLNGSVPLLAFGFSVMNVGEIWATAFLILRFGPARVRTVDDGVRFFLLSAPAAAGLSAGLSSLFALLAHRPDALMAGLTCGAAHFMGYTLVLPLGMTLSGRALADLRLDRRWPEALLVVGLVGAAALVCFAQTVGPFLFVITPFLLLATYRFRLIGANAAVLLVAVIAGPLTAHGLGPLALVQAGGEPVRVLVLQLFLATNSLIAVPLAASLGQRDRLLEAARRLERETAAVNAELVKIARISEIAEEVVRKGHFSVGPEPASVHWSPGVYDIFGLPRDAPALAEADALEFLHPADRDELRTALARCRSEQGSFDLLAGLTTAEGALCRVRIRARYVSGLAGGDVIIGVVRDVTAEEASARALEASERRFRQVAETAGDLIIQTTPAGRITYASPAVRDVIGLAPDEVVGRMAFDFILPEDRELGAAAAARAREAGQDSWTCEYRVRRTDGEIRWLEAKPRFVRDPADGRISGVTDILRDVTERRSLELALEAARAEAERSAAVKAEFLANMSHEFRTPLTSIIGFSDLLRPHLDNLPEPARYLERVASGSRLMLAIVNDVLDFSKLESGQIQLRPRPADPAALAASVVDLLLPQADAKGVALRLECTAEVPDCVEIDEERVRQVLLNIAGNAVKFTDAGDVAVTLDYGAGNLRFEVRDTGPGIPAEKTALLFQRFSQLDGSMTRSFGGTGLGLAISRGFVEAMGGEIGVESAPGGGARFWFSLPAAAVAPAPRAEAAGLDLQPLEGLRVLVADDNPNNREIIRAILTAAEIEVVTAEDGEEAVAASALAPFDLILMDVRMPGIGGAAAARLIREAPGPNDITPIIAFTAGAEGLSEDCGEARVFDAVLRKPIDQTALFAVLLSFAGHEAPKDVSAREVGAA